MALSEDQKAMLRLLAQRGEAGYEDIAALKGMSVDEVRAQVNDAVAQLEDEGLPPPALPLEPRPAKPEAPKPTEPREPAETREPATPAPLATPKPKPTASAPPKARKPKKPRTGGLSLPDSPALRGALAAAAAAVVIVIAIAVIGGGGGDGDETTTSASNQPKSGLELEQVASNNQVTKAELQPVGGGDASGIAVFGRVKNKLALQVEAEGLEPTTPDQAYTIWLADSPQRMLPLAFTPVESSGRNAGRIAAQFEAPVEVLGYLANETFDRIVVSLTESDRLTASLKQATSAKKAPSYTGTTVLEGTITGPIVGAALRGQNQQSKGK